MHKQLNEQGKVNTEITYSEKNSLLFYQGSIDRIVLEPFEKYLRNFYNISNSYEMLNVLLYPGIENEKTRVSECRLLNIQILNFMPELLMTYCNIYSAMCKSSFDSERAQSFYTYRKERKISFESLRGKTNYSFMSTSLLDKEMPEFCDKEGLVLLEFEIPKGIECIEMNAVCGENTVYSREQEVLLPPFLHFEIEEMDITDAEKRFHDINQEPPKGKYKIVILDSCIKADDEVEYYSNKEKREKLYQEITAMDEIQNAKQIWYYLGEEQEPEPMMLEKYNIWKEKIRLYLQLCFSHIKAEILGKVK